MKPGSIVLSHDFNQPDTIAAYEKLLPWLKANFTLGIPGEPAPAPTRAPRPPAPTPASTEPDRRFGAPHGAGRATTPS